MIADSYRRYRSRPVVVVIHRVAGLFIAGFLLVAGITGSFIAFDSDIDAWLNPHVFRTQSAGATLAPSALAAVVERYDGQLTVSSIPLRTSDGHAVVLGVRGKIDPATGRPHQLDINQLFVDPVNGDVLGWRNTRSCCDRLTIVPFIYRFHYNLGIPGKWGEWLMGVVALVWVLDCFFGAWLTLPKTRPIHRKWGTAFRLKLSASSYRVIFDLHRAGGLWFWGLLLLLAISSVYFNLYREVFRPAVELLSPLTPSVFEVRRGDPRSRQQTVLSFDEAVAIGGGAAPAHGITDRPSDILFSALNMYVVRFRPPGTKRGAGFGAPSIFVDAVDGSILGVEKPGQGTAGDIILAAQLPIHSGEIIGLPGRILVSVSGLVVAILSISGVIIWWRKRAARMAHRLRT